MSHNYTSGLKCEKWKKTAKPCFDSMLGRARAFIKMTTINCTSRLRQYDVLAKVTRRQSLQVQTTSIKIVTMFSYAHN